MKVKIIHIYVSVSDCIGQSKHVSTYAFFSVCMLSSCLDPRCQRVDPCLLYHASVPLGLLLVPTWRLAYLVYSYFFRFWCFHSRYLFSYHLNLFHTLSPKFSWSFQLITSDTSITLGWYRCDLLCYPSVVDSWRICYLISRQDCSPRPSSTKFYSFNSVSLLKNFWFMGVSMHICGPKMYPISLSDSSSSPSATSPSIFNSLPFSCFSLTSSTCSYCFVQCKLHPSRTYLLYLSDRT